ncbi:MAG: SecDF P1 head subdomain-containing protein [Lachnospiraceae bacterium]
MNEDENRKKYNLRNIMVLFLVIWCFGMAACSKDAESGNQQEKIEGDGKILNLAEHFRPHGNVVFKDEDGNVLLTVDDILSAESITNDNNGYVEFCVSIKFTEEGAEKFAEATEQNVGKVISIYVDDEILSAPTVQNKIMGREAIISCPGQTHEECQEIVMKIYGEGIIRRIARRQSGH